MNAPSEADHAESDGRRPRLILLNGPPAVGKSTLAALYVDDHPGTLNLDLDRLHPLIGGWRALDGSTHEIVRPLALAMAAAHLASGRDVIVPQFLADPAQAARFEAVAADTEAEFVEIMLTVQRDDVLTRFAKRTDGTAADSAWERHNQEVVAHHGGNLFLAELFERHLTYLAGRPDARRVPSEPGSVPTTYTALVAALQPE